MFGNEYNSKYPPNKEVYGNSYDGYASPNQLTFFYDFCIQHYGVAFYYNDNLYETDFREDGPVLINKTTNIIQGPFEDAMKLLEESKLNGKNLIEILEELEHVVLH